MKTAKTGHKPNNMKVYKDETGRIVVDGEGHAMVYGTVTLDHAIKDAVLITNFYIEPAKGEPGFHFVGKDHVEITNNHVFGPA